MSKLESETTFKHFIAGMSMPHNTTRILIDIKAYGLTTIWYETMAEKDVVQGILDRCLVGNFKQSSSEVERKSE